MKREWGNVPIFEVVDRLLEEIKMNESKPRARYTLEFKLKAV